MDGAPEVGDGPDAEIRGQPPLDFLHGLVPIQPEGQVQGRHGPGARPAQEYAVRVDAEVFPSQQVCEGGVGVFQRPVFRLPDLLLDRMEPQPVVDGNRHIAQRGEILPPAFLAGLAFVADEKGPAMHHQQQRPSGRRIVPGRRIDVHLQGDGLRDAAVEHQLEGGSLVPDGGVGVIARGGGIRNILLHLHLIGRRSERKGHGEEQREQAHHQKDAANRRPNRVVFSIFASISSGVL